MKIVVTGGNGYIGARVSKTLAELGHKVVPVCRQLHTKDVKWMRLMDSIIIGDINDDSTINKIAHENADVIIHLISLDHHKSELDPNFVNKVNVMSTWRLLHYCVPRGLKKFIYFSTTQVYGKLDNKVIYEDDPLKPLNIYGLTHLLSEEVCEYFNNNSNCNVISIRLSNSYGSPVFSDNNCWWLVINDLSRSAILNNEIKLLSDGSPLRDFIHFEDLVNAVVLLVNYQVKLTNNVYNLSSGITYSILEIAEIIRDELYKRSGRSINVITGDAVTGKRNDSHIMEHRYTISNLKLSKIGFRSKISISYGVNELMDYFQKM